MTRRNVCMLYMFNTGNIASRYFLDDCLNPWMWRPQIGKANGTVFMSPEQGLWICSSSSGIRQAWGSPFQAFIFFLVKQKEVTLSIK